MKEPHDDSVGMLIALSSITFGPVIAWFVVLGLIKLMEAI